MNGEYQAENLNFLMLLWWPSCSPQKPKGIGKHADFTSMPFQPKADLPRKGGVMKTLYLWSNRWDSNLWLLIHS